MYALGWLKMFIQFINLEIKDFLFSVLTLLNNIHHDYNIFTTIFQK